MGDPRDGFTLPKEEDMGDCSERRVQVENVHVNDAAPKQVGGSHYQLAIQPIDYILKNNLGYCEGNVIKYVTRHKDKNGAEDIKKAIHYLEFILESMYASKTTEG